MAALFDRETSGIRRHIRGVFKDGELPEADIYRKIPPVNPRGRPEPSYSLDVIISVGYRVKSQRGIEFRQWATRVINERLTNDYRRRAEEAERYIEGMRNIESLAQDRHGPPEDILGLILGYSKAWRLLRQYDENKLPPPPASCGRRMARLTAIQADKIVQAFRVDLIARGEASEYFGRPRSEQDDGLGAILRGLEQTWGGKPLYPNITQRAAHLLYLVIKDHPFIDGNKRIASLLFLHYLKKNGRDLRSDGTPLFNENSIFALALLVASSDAKHKDATIRIITSLIEEP
jgi:prophage maintenance system killer protein